MTRFSDDTRAPAGSPTGGRADGRSAAGLIDRLGRMVRSAPRAPATVPPGQRIYAIGDIHGRLDLLDALTERIRIDHDTRGGGVAAEIIMLGDLIDRGPDSAGVVRRAMAGYDWARLEVLRGNHEDAMLKGLHGDRDMLRLWFGQGGDAALLSWDMDPAFVADSRFDDLVSVALATIPAAELAWLADRPFAVRRGDYHFVHAGIRPGVPLDRQTPVDALWIREPFLRSRRDHGVTVVHGHTRTDAVEDRGNRIGIDTGAYVSGTLTALGLEDSRRWTLST